MNETKDKTKNKQAFIKKLNTVLIATVCVLSCVLVISLFNNSSIKKANKEKLIEKVNSPFSTSANIKYKDIIAAATISSETPKTCKVLFSSPKSIEGMSFILSDEEVFVDYKGMNFSFDPNSLPGGAVANVVVAAINSATQKDGVTVEVKENVLEVSGESDAGEFILRLDKSNGNFLKLVLPENDLELEFVNFKFLE